MSDTNNETTAKVESPKTDSKHELPKGTSAEFEYPGSPKLTYTVEADWMLLRKEEEPAAEIFFTAYIAKSTSDSHKSTRPLTFVFNGGPGAASAYLHVGGLGPKRVQFEDKGSLPPPPAQLVDNKDSWLPFSDLIFVDPVGTGFSRSVKKKGPKSESPKNDNSEAEGLDKEFYGINRDLDSLGEFIQRCLSRYGRWTSPIYIAGESYGGFRVAKLTRRLQESFGVSLSGAILISPALELGLLSGSDYDAHMWIDTFPSFVSSAWTHKVGRFADSKITLEEALSLGETFALGSLAKILIGGGFLSEKERQSIFEEYASLTGLKTEYVALKEARISPMDFVRQLFRSDRKVCGIYDASVTLYDPFPDRDTFQGPEPTLFAIDRIFGSGINSLLRDWLKVQSDRDYRLLSMEVHANWKVDEKRHVFDALMGATDDLRYGMALNPHMKVFITHGYFDLVTPYFASKRLASLLKITPSQRKQLTMKNFFGGHMFYSWKESREDFTKTVAHWIKDAGKV